MSRVVVSVKGATKEYVSGGMFGGKAKLRALRGIDLEVREGEVLGLVGESGCGKSTLSRLLLGIEEPTTGTVEIDGRSIASYGRLERARLMQPVFQDPYSSLNPRITVGGIVAAPLAIRGEGNAASQRKRARDILGLVGLPQHLFDAYPNQLSGGQRQRVAIARALIGEPKILICDEPTSALDVSVQSQILNLLAKIREEMGLTLVLISHNLAVVNHIADRVAVMYLGRIAEEGASQQLFDNPRHPYTAALLSSILLPVPGSRMTPMPLPAELPSPFAVIEGCAFSPRCPRALDLCRVQVPSQSTEASTDVAGVGIMPHQYQCHSPLPVAQAQPA